MKIKKWFMEKLDREAGHYFMGIDFAYREDGLGYAEEDDCLFPYVDEVLKETEKAVQVRFSTGITDGSMKGWLAWVPKSLIMEM